MESEGPLLCSQQHATGSYSSPNDSNPYPPNPTSSSSELILTSQIGPRPQKSPIPLGFTNQNVVLISLLSHP
jgi:hypothetical protein